MTDTTAYDELLRLEAALSQLVQQRNEAIAQATRDIAEANRWFDSECLPVSRRINELREELDEDYEEVPVPKPRRKREKKLPEPDPEWSEEERAHFNKLVRG